MYIFQNALKNITRNKGRNILLAVIIFAIVTAIVVSLAINNTSSAVIDDYKDRFGLRVYLSPDMEKARSNTTSGNVQLPKVPTELLLILNVSVMVLQLPSESISTMVAVRSFLLPFSFVT